MTLLSMVQDACDELGVAKPTSVVGSSDQTSIQMLAIANAEGRSLRKRHNWTVLAKEHSFSTVSSTASYALPTDGDSPFRIIDGTCWDQTNNFRIAGPMTPQNWQTLQQGTTSLSDLSSVFRVFGGLFYLYPLPTSVRTISYEYIIENWCEAAGGEDQSAWAADTDVGLLDEELMRLGIMWRFMKAKGLPYAEERQHYDEEVRRAIARDGGRPIINLARSQVIESTFGANLPEVGFG